MSKLFEQLESKEVVQNWVIKIVGDLIILCLGLVIGYFFKIMFY